MFGHAYHPFYDQRYARMYVAPLAGEYVEKAEDARSPHDYWYYCPSLATYYPYVSECTEGWQTMEPLFPQR